MNPYTIILSLFVVASLFASIWGWIIISKGRKTLDWPSVTGFVEESTPTSELDDLLPHILFSYTVSGQIYQHMVNFPSGMTPTPEFTASYMERFPVGASVQVYYDPQKTDNATLEPGPVKGDWLVFTIGICSALLGILFLLFGGQ